MSHTDEMHAKPQPNDMLLLRISPNPDETLTKPFLPLEKVKLPTRNRAITKEKPSQAKHSKAKQSKAEDGPHLINTTCRRCCYTCCFATLLRTSRPLQETTHRSANLRHNQDLNSDFRELRKEVSVSSLAFTQMLAFLAENIYSILDGPDSHYAVDRRSISIVCSWYRH